MIDMTWDEFEVRLIKAGWSPQEAHAERLANEFGELGDCDGDLHEAEVEFRPRNTPSYRGGNRK